MIPPLANDPKYRSLDAWRGVICVLVVLEHSAVALWSGGWVTKGWEGWVRWAMVTPMMWNLGAPLFFVISGYCIAASLDSTRRRGGDASGFLIKRFWRIFPPYWASVLFCLVVVVGLDAIGMEWLHRGNYALELGSPTALNLQQWVGNLTLTETWRPHVWGHEATIFTRVAWSLCYQEQFYLVCVLALMLAPRKLFGILAAASAAILFVRVESWDIGFMPRIEGFFPDLWHEFAVGIAVYWRLNIATKRYQRHLVDAVLVGMLLVAAGAGFATTVGASAFGLILIGFRRFDAKVDRLAFLKPVKALGRMSYSVYLVHLPIVVVVSLALTGMGMTGYWTRALVVVPIATIAALYGGSIFHNKVDRHFHQLPTRRPKSSSGPFNLRSAPQPIPATA